MTIAMATDTMPRIPTLFRGSSEKRCEADHESVHDRPAKKQIDHPRERRLCAATWRRQHLGSGTNDQ